MPCCLSNHHSNKFKALKSNTGQKKWLWKILNKLHNQKWKQETLYSFTVSIVSRKFFLVYYCTKYIKQFAIMLQTIL